MAWPSDIEELIDAARKHGEKSEPDHEVGDLQGLLRRAWELMTEKQRQRLLISGEAQGVWEDAGNECD